MARKQLKSPSDVIDVLGGNAAVSQLTGTKYKTVHMWRHRLPAKTYLMLSAELAKLGYDAPPALWGMSDPEQRVAS